MARSPRWAVLRRLRRRAGLVARRSWRWAQVVKETRADRCRFQVAAAARCQRSITVAYCSGVNSTTGWPGPVTVVRRVRVSA
ncbi:hypothetical protein ACFQYP_64375 [Nonomuraea antimicrobica]